MPISIAFIEHNSMGGHFFLIYEWIFLKVFYDSKEDIIIYYFDVVYFSPNYFRSITDWWRSMFSSWVDISIFQSFSAIDC